jgi:hypothetical protein
MAFFRAFRRLTMPRDTLLREAIADAKAIRDAAIANAKLTLEEQFKPQLSSMLSARLRNEIEGDINEDNDGSSEIGGGGVTVDEPAPKMPSATTRDSSHIKNDGQEVEPMGEAFGKPEEEPLPDDPNAAPAGDPAISPTGGRPAFGAAPSAAVDVHPDAHGGEEIDVQGMGGAPSEDELDLDAIIRELELDVQDGEGGDPAAAGAGAAPAAGGAPRFEAYSDAMAGAKVDGAMDGSCIKEEAEGVSKDGISEKAVHGVNDGQTVKPGQEVTTGTMDKGMNEEVDLDEILREMEAEESAPVVETEQIAAENAELKESLKEHREVIQFLREKIMEVNMLNTKLLFTNKLFRSFNLNNGQKMRVVETVREVKLIYTTLAESFVGKTGTAVSKNTKTITEGMASKPTGSTKPKQQQILAEGDAMVARMQKLAGINR